MKLKNPKESKITMEEFTKLCAEPIDWEQRRYEVAKALLPTVYNLYFSNAYFEQIVEAGVDEEHPEFLQVINQYVLEQTDELIKELKKGGEE